MAIIKWVKTAHKGLRYYDHPERKHGKKKDRYYAIHFKVSNKVYDYGVGWWSEGIPDEDKKNHPQWGFEDYAVSELHRYKANIKSGSGPRSPKEKRGAADERRKEQERVKADEQKAARTLADYSKEIYFPWADEHKKPNSLRSEKTLFRLWIKPAIGDLPMVQVSETALGRLKKKMMDKGRAPKTINLALAVVRQIFNHAKQRRDYGGDNPVSQIKKPLVDNAKLRYLSPPEIDALLNALAQKSQAMHDQALLAVNAGLRFSEVAGLTWQDVNFETRSLSIRDSKTGSRTAFLNDSTEAMLKLRREDSTGNLVFPGYRKKKKDGVLQVTRETEEVRQTAVSKTFQRVADQLFNQGVDDRRLRISFHSLRHSFGSLVYQQTGDIYLTGKALGHKTMVMAMRYAKQSETKLRSAFETMGNVIDTGKADGGQVVNLRR